MNTSNNLEQQCAQAMQRINEGINRSAGQHKRAVRRIAAGAVPPDDFRSVDTERLAAGRVFTSEGSTEEPGDLVWIAYLLVALALTACAGFAAFLIVNFT